MTFKVLYSDIIIWKERNNLEKINKLDKECQ